MKNQYVGDISDFEKYSILRSLSDASGRELSVCWLLTEDDSSRDGRRLRYLQQPDTFRTREPFVFDRLKSIVESGSRSVSSVESSDILGAATFHSSILTDNATDRAAYFEEFWAGLSPHSLIFFDPDNGIGPPSQKVGRANSSKYVFSEEIARSYKQGHSVVIFQHWPRVERQSFLQGHLAELSRTTGAANPFALHGGRVAFIVLPQAAVATELALAGRELAQRWTGPQGLRFTAVSPSVDGGTSPVMRLHAVTVLVDDYDTAIRHYVDDLGFTLLEDTALSPAKRWVRVAPSADSGSCLLLAQASNPEQVSMIGKQGAGRVQFFLHVADFDFHYARMRERAVAFIGEPRTEEYGKVIVFADHYGNLWDLVQPFAQHD